MPYEHWRHCPPRAQIGRVDAICGTMDHLVLLMARLSDFGGKDKKRKMDVLAANGGQWRPPPGFFPPSHGGAPPTATKAPSGTSQAPPASVGTPSASKTSPPMYGMMPPPTAPPQMPAAFATMTANLEDTGGPNPAIPPPSPATPIDVDLDTETRVAEADWRNISEAFDLFRDSLPPEFEPFAPDAAPAIQTTPFGTALQYRTHTISCIWTFYYAGRILVERLHPAMPPAAMAAAGIAAAKTAKYAETIGKICAGLYYPQQYDFNLNPGLGSALIESTFTLFFAAVQYRDPGQRGWTISKLRHIAQRTGWQTSSAIAAGCEISWEKMGQAGKGPPYTPTMDRTNADNVSNEMQYHVFSY